MTYASRKFMLALIAIGASIAGLITGKIGGGEWVAAITVILGLYGAANVGEKYVEKK